MSRHNVRTLEKLWTTYDRVYADKGVVIIIDKEGRKHHKSVREAATHARKINATLGNPQVPEDKRRRYMTVIEQLLPIIREAMFQAEAPKDLATKLVTNVIGGKTAEGKPIPIDNTYEGRLKRLMFRFPMLKENEIEAVCRQLIPMEQKIGILHAENEGRLMDIVMQMQQRQAAAAQAAGTPAE